jgi:uncharacterized protein (DUF362 family)
VFGENCVAIVKAEAVYPEPPFSPGEPYPEYQFDDCRREGQGAPNPVYRAVREALLLLGLDRDRFGTVDWNPFGEIIKPGQRVLVKPNFVNSQHAANGDLQSVVTHGSVLRAVIDYVILALKGNGQILIADSPERVADFGRILTATGTNDLLAFYRSRQDIIGQVGVVARDMRRQTIEYWKGAISRCTDLEGDPEGYTRIALSEEQSAFKGIDKKTIRRLYGADYNRRETIKAHSGGRHEYEIPNSVLNSDVILSVPKLKTHYRVGTTLNCKGFVGLNGNKNLIPHRIVGDPSSGGDTYDAPPRTISGALYRRLNDSLKDLLLARQKNQYAASVYAACLKAAQMLLDPPREDIAYHGGCWHGNDTTWRSVVDIVRIVHFSDAKGRMEATRQRRFFSLIDGIVGGDRDGPMKPRLRKAGVIVAGSNLIGVDAAATNLMGFQPLHLKYLAALLQPCPCFDLSLHYPDDIQIHSNDPRFAALFSNGRDSTLCFEAPFSWQGNGMELA